MEKYGKYIEFCFSNKQVQMFIAIEKAENFIKLNKENYHLPISSESLSSNQTKLCYTFADTVDEHVIRVHFPKGEERELDKLLEKA